MGKGNKPNGRQLLDRGVRKSGLNGLWKTREGKRKDQNGETTRSESQGEKMGKKEKKSKKGD